MKDDALDTRVMVEPDPFYSLPGRITAEYADLIVKHAREHRIFTRREAVLKGVTAEDLEA